MSNIMDSVQVNSDGRVCWAEIQEISNRLSQHARNRDWDAVCELHARREGLLHSYFAESIAVSEANAVREGVLAVLESDKEVIALTRQERSNAAAKMHGLQSGREASKAYRDTKTGN